ncbi:unannotated protein [freshwater metagenome]|uniref:Unannotated protein n=1 Tax=freshwater metagenome TaxID=449393 RepID=A0A6J7PB78_9ZZZZ
MIRCALSAHVATVSRTAAGRGAWLCSYECFRTAERKKAFERAWKASISAAIVRDLDEKVRFAFEGVIINMEQFSSTKG